MLNEPLNSSKFGTCGWSSVDEEGSTTGVEGLNNRYSSFPPLPSQGGTGDLPRTSTDGESLV